MEEKMTLDRFWDIIEQGRKPNETETEIVARLTDSLSALDEESIVQWWLICDYFHREADKGKLWGAANIMDDGFCSDDGFHYFRAWLIGQGRDVYLAALKDPDSLAGLPRQEDVRFERINYVAVSAYEDLTGKDFYDAIVDRFISPELQQEISSSIVFAPDMDNEKYINGEYPGIYPKLTALYTQDDIGEFGVFPEERDFDEMEDDSVSVSEKLAKAKKILMDNPPKPKPKWKAEMER